MDLNRTKRTLPEWMKGLVRNNDLRPVDKFNFNFCIFFLFKFKKKHKECSVRIERLELESNEDQTIDGNENINSLNQIAENNDQKMCSPVKRYRTRSSLLRSDLVNGDAQMQQKKSSSVSIPRPKPAFIDYKGKVEYYTEFHDIAFASDNLL